MRIDLPVANLDLGQFYARRGFAYFFLVFGAVAMRKRSGIETLQSGFV